MALINCPECKREVSDKAIACPGCGSPLSGVSMNSSYNLPSKTVRNVRSGGIWELCGFILIVAGMIAGMAGAVSPGVVGMLMGVGFVSFVIGRFF